MSEPESTIEPVRLSAEEYQRSIYRISGATQATENLDELFEFLHGVIGELMPASNFYIALYDAATDLIHFPYYRDELETETWVSIHPGRSLTGLVLRTKEPLLATPDVFRQLLQSGEVDLVGPPSVDWLGVPLKTQRGEVIGVMAVQTYAESVRLYESDKDVLVFVSTQVAMAIERKRAEERLRREHALLGTLLRHLPDAVYVKDREGRFLVANPVVSRLMGAREPEELVGKTDFDFYPQEIAARFRQDEAEVVRSGKALIDYEEARPDEEGNLLRITTTKVPLRDENGAIIGLVGVSRDLTEHARAEEALRASQARLQSIFKASPTGIGLSRGGVVLEVNDRLSELTGLSRAELLDRDFRSLYLSQEDSLATQNRLEIELRKKGWATVESRWQRKDGAILDILLNLAPVDATDLSRGEIFSVTDISEQKNSERERARLEEQLRQSQKLESIGRLAGGVAHDFNNLLTAISGNLQLALMDLDQASLPVARLQQALRATQSAATLTQQLLAFSRKQIIEPRVIDLNEVVSNIREMLARLIGEDLDLVINSSPSKALVKADPGQIEQMIINLCVNARDAMPGGGRLTLGIGNVVLDETYCEDHKNASPGQYVRLSVSDNGVGMSKDVIGQIFEPFFTTKATGKGTGLGLAMVYGAVRQNGGSIEVYSEPGKGTSFKIYLPRVVAEGVTPSAGLPSSSLPAGSETVLLVEDADFIRSFARDILTRLGYQVIDCASVKEAIERERDYPEAIHLLLTDVILPDGSSRDLAAAIAAGRPGIKTLYTSGYAEDVIAHHGVLDPGVQFIGKPFSAAALAKRIRQVLDQG
jgi:two-component system, cell cycle sensor histidine kinase and response regulator CckA